MLYNVVTLLFLKGRNMQRNEIIETINQKTFEAKKLINEINNLKRLLSNYDNQLKINLKNNIFGGIDIK